MKKITLMTLILTIAIAVFAVSASALPASVVSAKLDGLEIWPGDNRLSIERGEEFELKIVLVSSQDLTNIEAEVFISGYEYSDYEDISDRTHNFDMEANVSYKKSFTLKLPIDIESDDYKLRLIVSDRYGNELTESYNLKIDAPRHSLRLSDLIVSPDSKVVAGRALIATVRLENLGEKDEKSIKVTVSVPELGLSDSAYLDEIEAGEEEETEELYMRIPTCAEEGIYDFEVEIKYDRKRETIKETMQIVILESETCTDYTPTFNIESTSLSAEAGKATSFQIVVENRGINSKAFTLSISGTEGWAESRISPAGTAVIESGESKTFIVEIKPDKKAAGAKSITATLSSGSKELGKVALGVNVTAKQGMGFTTAIEIVLVVLVAALVGMALVFGIRRMKAESEAYC